MWCRIGWHKWTKWKLGSSSVTNEAYVQKTNTMQWRECTRCDRKQIDSNF